MAVFVLNSQSCEGGDSRAEPVRAAAFEALAAPLLRGRFDLPGADRVTVLAMRRVVGVDDEGALISESVPTVPGAFRSRR